MLLGRPHRTAHLVQTELLLRTDEGKPPCGFLDVRQNCTYPESATETLALGAYCYLDVASWPPLHIRFRILAFGNISEQTSMSVVVCVGVPFSYMHSLNLHARMWSESEEGRGW